MTTNPSNQKILKVLRKMDDVLHRYGVNHYQERIHRIHKVLLSLERHSSCYVSNFSLENFDNDLNDKFSQINLNNTEQNANSPIKEFNDKTSFAEYQKPTGDLKLIEIEYQTNDKIDPFMISSPVKTKRMSNFFNFAIEKANEDLKFEQSEISKTINSELDELFKFIEDELNGQSVLRAQDSTQFSSNSEEDEEEENFNESTQINLNNHKDENDSEVLSAEEEIEKAKEDSIFISVLAKKKANKLKNSRLIKQNDNTENKDDLINNNNISLFENFNDDFNHKQTNEFKIVNNKNKAASSLIKTDKKFSSSQKQNEAEKETKFEDILIANKAQKEQAKADFKNIFSKIEVKLRNYLKQSHHQKIFESKAFESFLNEEKLRTPCSFNTAKSQTPSIIKNFFEDKEVIEVTRKRHSVAGECIKNQLEQIREFEFKQKCFSNLRDNQGLLRKKESILDRKESGISDFSVNLSDNGSIKEFEALGCERERNPSDFGGTVDDGTGAPRHRISGLKLSKRGSILRERLSNFNSTFDVVQEEERFVDLDQSADLHQDGIKGHEKEESD